MKKTVCKEKNCVGCNACVQICRKDAVRIEDHKYYLDAVIDSARCVECGMCSKVCQQNTTPSYHHALAWYQGWSNNEEIRIKSASGGIATAAAQFFLKKNYSVYACRFLNGKLIYQKVANEKQLVHFAGSKYVKSDTSTVYSEIKSELKAGTNVLFIGLPCHVQGLKLFLGDKLQEKLFTVDLICHGTPSFALYKQYLEEKGVKPEFVSDVSFRQKTAYTASYPKNFEYWNFPFLNGLTFTENCYDCKFACEDRISDITIGDSWGSELGIDEKNKGISLIICNTEKGLGLINSLDLHLEYVDIKKAQQSNRQLLHSTARPENRKRFVNSLIKTDHYHKSIGACYPKYIVKAALKRTIIGSLLKKIRKNRNRSDYVKIECIENVVLKD